MVLSPILTPHPSGSPPDQLFDNTARGVLLNSSSNVEPIPVVYGRRKVGGVSFLREVFGTDNANLAKGLIVSEGPIQSMQNCYLDDVLSDDARFSGVATITTALGTDTQAAMAGLLTDLPEQWDATCKLSGAGYVYAKLTWSDSAYQGEPQLTFDVLGRTLYDPRDAGTRFSNNPALIIRDYLTNTRYGLGIPESAIDDTAFSAAANHCDERATVPTHTATFTAADATNRLTFEENEIFGLGDGVTVSSTGSLPTGLSAATTYYVVPVAPNEIKLATTFANALAETTIDLTSDGSGTMTVSHVDQARYTADGVVNVDNTPMENLPGILAACRGFLVYSGGVYKLKIDKAETALTWEFTEDNIVGGWQIQLPGKRGLYNRVRARFFNPAKQWQPDLAVYDNTTYRTADNEILLEAELDLPFVTDPYRAGRIAQMAARQSRFGIVATFRSTIKGLRAEVGDVVGITHSTPGWSSQLFRVMALELLSNDEVNVTVRQYSSTVYTLDAASEQLPAPATNLPDPFSVGVPGILSVVESLYATTGSAGVKSRATVTVGASADHYVVSGGRYQVEYKLSSASTWKVGALGPATIVVLDDLVPGLYNFRVRAINAMGAQSSYSNTFTQELFGLTAAPSSPANFAVQSYNGQAKFTWDKPTATNDLDVLLGGRAFVRWTSVTSGATWQDGVLVNPDGYPGDTTIGVGPLQTGTYMLKFRDSSGNYSVTEASFVVTEALLAALSGLVTVTESPTFTGTKTNVDVVDTKLQLVGSTLWDSIPGNIDDWDFVDSVGGISSTGSYAFASRMDLGSVKIARLYSNIVSTAFDTGDFWDSRTTNIDDWGLVDGAVIEDAEVKLMVRKTDDDPASGGATWGSWHPLGIAADYSARGFEFRLDFTSGSPNHNRQVATLSVTAKQ